VSVAPQHGSLESALGPHPEKPARRASRRIGEASNAADGVDLEVVVAPEFIEDHRTEPTQDEYSDDHVTENAKIGGADRGRRHSRQLRRFRAWRPRMLLRKNSAIAGVRRKITDHQFASPEIGCTSDGRSHGSRVNDGRRSSRFPSDHDWRRLAACSCEGSRGVGRLKPAPRSLLIPEGNHRRPS
jgi:hypothetical protein